MMSNTIDTPDPGPTIEEAQRARRAFLRSGPGALARGIGIPAVAAQIRANLPPTPVPDLPLTPDRLPAQQPLFDILDEGEQILAVADLPGASADTLQINIVNNILFLQVCKTSAVYRCDLPADIDQSTLQWTLRNGILEIRLQKLRSLMLG